MCKYPVIICNLQASVWRKQWHCKTHDKGASVLYLCGICKQQVRFLQDKPGPLLDTRWELSLQLSL